MSHNIYYNLYLENKLLVKHIHSGPVPLCIFCSYLAHFIVLEKKTKSIFKYNKYNQFVHWKCNCKNAKILYKTNIETSIFQSKTTLLTTLQVMQLRYILHLVKRRFSGLWYWVRGQKWTKSEHCVCLLHIICISVFLSDLF